MMRRIQSIFSSNEAKNTAEDDVTRARNQIQEQTNTIRNDLAAAEQKHRLLQCALQDAIAAHAPKKHMVQLTQKIKQAGREIDTKRNLLSNMQRENRQLGDALTNNRVTGAMIESVEAQKRLSKLNLGGRETELDDILDDIEDNRQQTRDLTDRLAARGGDSDDEIFDESIFSEHDIVDALGQRNHTSDVDFAQRYLNHMAEAGYEHGDPESIPREHVSQRNADLAVYHMPSAPSRIPQPTARATRGTFKHIQ